MKVCGLFRFRVQDHVMPASLLALESHSQHNLAMRPSTALEIHREAIVQIVESHNALNPRVFGSVAHGTDSDDSDLDILIDPTANTSLMDVAKIQVELEAILGAEVDVLSPNALPDSFRHIVLAAAIPV
jgi:uncharacterized protein